MLKIKSKQFKNITEAVASSNISLFIGQESDKFNNEYLHLQKQFKELQEFQKPFTNHSNKVISFLENKLLVFINNIFPNDNTLKKYIYKWLNVANKLNCKSVCINIVNIPQLHNTRNKNIVIHLIIKDWYLLHHTDIENVYVTSVEKSNFNNGIMYVLRKQ